MAYAASLQHAPLLCITGLRSACSSVRAMLLRQRPVHSEGGTDSCAPRVFPGCLLAGPASDSNAVSTFTTLTERGAVLDYYSKNLICLHADLSLLTVLDEQA